MHAAICSLIAEHKTMVRVLNALSTEIKKIRPGEGPDYGLLFRSMKYLGTYPDQCHYPMEEAILRAILRNDTTRETVIRHLIEEHAKIDKLTDDLNGILRSAVCGDIQGRADLAHLVIFVEVLRRHIETENQIVFPLADRVLCSNELDQIATEFADGPQQRLNSFPPFLSADHWDDAQHTAFLGR